MHLYHGFDIIFQMLNGKIPLLSHPLMPFRNLFCKFIGVQMFITHTMSPLCIQPCLMFSRVCFVLTLQNNRMYNMNVECSMRVHLPLTDLHVWVISLFSVRSVFFVCYAYFFVSFGYGMFSDISGNGEILFVAWNAFVSYFHLFVCLCVDSIYISVHCNYIRFQ